MKPKDFIKEFDEMLAKVSDEELVRDFRQRGVEFDLATFRSVIDECTTMKADDIKFRLWVKNTYID